MGKLAQRVALVTGGASGLGKVIAERLASDGATVVITDIQTELGQAVAAEGALTFLKQDVTDEVQWSEIVQQVEKRHGHLDILINSAGIVGPLDASTPEHTTFSDWKKIFSINVDGVFLGCRAAIPAMRRAGGGSIVNISSVAGLLSSSQATAYGTSKATVRHLTKAVAQYGAEWNIRCNSVHPGHARTPMGDKVAEEHARLRGGSVDDIYEDIRAGTPLGRLVTPEDVAATVAFLASDEASLISGTKMIVDGGVIYCRTYRAPKEQSRNV